MWSGHMHQIIASFRYLSININTYMCYIQFVELQKVIQVFTSQIGTFLRYKFKSMANNRAMGYMFTLA